MVTVGRTCGDHLVQLLHKQGRATQSRLPRMMYKWLLKIFTISLAVFSCPHSTDVFPDVQTGFLVSHFVVIASCPGTKHNWKEPQFHPLGTLPSGIYRHRWDSPLILPFFRLSPSSVSLFSKEQYSTTLVVPCWILSICPRLPGAQIWTKCSMNGFTSAERITSLVMLLILYQVQLKIPLAFLVAKAHCLLIVFICMFMSSSTSRSFSTMTSHETVFI